MDGNEKVVEFRALHISTVMKEIDVLTDLAIERELTNEELTDKELSRFVQLSTLHSQMENPSRDSMSNLVRMLLGSWIDGKALAPEAVQYVLERLNGACDSAKENQHEEISTRNARIVSELHLTRPDRKQAHQKIVYLICRVSFQFKHKKNPVKYAIKVLDEFDMLGESVIYANRHFKKYSEFVWFELALQAKWGKEKQIYYKNRLSPERREMFNRIPKKLLLEYQRNMSSMLK